MALAVVLFLASDFLTFPGRGFALLVRFPGGDPALATSLAPRGKGQKGGVCPPRAFIYHFREYYVVLSTIWLETLNP